MDRVVLRTKRDVITFVNDHPTGSSRGRIIALIALGSIFIDAYDFTSLAIGLDTMKAELNPTPFQVGTTTSAMAVGALLGAIFGGYLVDKLGRYKLLILDLVLFVVAALGSALSPSIGILIFWRFLLGVGVGLDMPAALSLVAEFTRNKDKGKFVNLWQPMWYLATITSAAFVLPLVFLGMGDHMWRWAVGFGAVPALIVLALRFLFADESPMWAAHNLGMGEAVKILRKNFPGTEFEIEEGEEEKEADTRLGRIFESGYRVRSLVVAVVSGFQAVQYFAVGFYLPVIVGLIFGLDVTSIVLGTILLNLFGLVGGGIQPFLTHRYGGRALTFIGCAICVVALIAVGMVDVASAPYLAAMLVGAFIFGHSFGPGSQGKTMATLSYPTDLRGTGTGWAEACSRVGSIGGFYVFPLVVAAVGLSHTMIILAVVPLIIFITVLVARWDPKDVDIEGGSIRPVRAGNEKEALSR
ncbi:MFS transporter [Brachybacterium subflavum]|uniref:MFS transporter n=1 Tax=Brachybacterium subflavum TaxID=2585206 RepID=UPI0012662C7A|nr:MFS transporter [Brachybacterium subflavum]